MAEPFERLSREVLIENPWHRYCRDRYVQRDGSEGEYFYVDMAGSAGIVPLFADGTTQLVQVRRYLLGGWVWEFPIGGMNPGENALDVAKKELAEETGLRAGTWTSLGRFAPYKGVSNDITWFFLAQDLVQGEQDLEASEDIRVERMPMAEARERLLSQDILDGQSISGLVLLDRFLAMEGSEAPGYLPPVQAEAAKDRISGRREGET